MYPDHVETYHILRKHQTEQCRPNGIQAYHLCLFAVITIKIDKDCREQLYEQQHHKLSQRGRSVPQHHILIADADHEIDHHRHAREQDATRHPFPIKHQEKCQIDQCRPRLLLTDNENHRQQHYRTCHSKILPLMDIKAIRTHELTDSQRRGKFCELSGLQTHRTEHQPRTGTFNLVGVEYRCKKQHQHKGIQHIGESIEETVVEHQQHKSQTNRRSNPDNLHT